MKKIDVVTAFVSYKQEAVRKIEKALGVIHREIIDAPGAMQSHSDTSKFQSGNIAAGVDNSLALARDALLWAQRLPAIQFDEIVAGCFFIVKDSDGNLMQFLLLPSGGGDSFSVDMSEISTISKQAPLVATLQGKRKGDTVLFRGRRMEVIDVQ